MTTKVLCIGDVMLDVITKISVAPAQINFGSDTPASISSHGGGAAGNVAAWLSRTDACATIVGRVGNDAAGKIIITEFNALGVRHNNLMVENGQTGVVIVLVDVTGERTMFPDSGSSSEFTLADLPDLNGFDAIYLSGYSPLNPNSLAGIKEMIAAIKAAGTTLYFDPASVGGMKSVAIAEVKSWLPHMDVIIMNEEEAIYLTDSPDLERALDIALTWCDTAIIKLGANGAMGRTSGESTVYVHALETKVVDTTGAGDSFAAGFIASFANKADLRAALVAGCELAAHCVAIVGARPRVGTSI